MTNRGIVGRIADPIPQDPPPYSLADIGHKLKATLREAKKHAIPRGASDIIVVREAIDGTLKCSPLLVHFGKGLFPAKMHDKFLLGRVEMKVDGRKVRGMHLRMGRNGIVETQSFEAKHLKGILRRDKHRSHYPVQYLVKDWKGRTVRVGCSLYYWESTAKLVISDIDGTVTKSDLWGMVLEKAWIQPDVRELYRRIKDNGYRLVYLSARPASTGTLTRNFLNRLNLPSGPLWLSSETLGKALKTSVTDPERVKVRGMLKLQELFFDDSSIHQNIWYNRQHARMRPNTFHAAFGNQETDQFAYEMLSIPLIFMVDQTGRMTISRVGTRGKVTSRAEGRSFRHLIENMDEYFPKTKDF